MSHSVQAQDFLSPQDFKDYMKNMDATNCSNPKNKDRWQIREPTEEEIFELGRGILVFEYWNSLARCSDTFNGGVYFGGLRFLMQVEVLDDKHQSMERITISTGDSPYHVFDPVLMLHDGAEPGRIILYPLLS